jgi:predicted nucleic acid-binding protein
MAVDLPGVYWDSCIFIHALQKTPGHAPKILAIENDAKDGKLVVYVSALVIVEVCKLKRHGTTSDHEVRQISDYFRHKFVRVVPVDRPIARMAAEIVRNHDLKPPDAIHVATALRTKCEVFYTYDGDGNDPGLLKMSGVIGSPALPIKRPGEWGQMTIPMLSQMNPPASS